jgi:signal transduction histidine kinase
VLGARATQDKNERPYSRKDVEEAFLGVNPVAPGEIRESAIEVIRGPEATRDIFLRMVADAREQVMLLLPSVAAFHREEKIGVIESLEAGARRGVMVQILSPMDAAIQTSVARMNRRLVRVGKPPLELTESKETSMPGTVTVLVVDRKAALVIEQVRPSSLQFLKAIGSSTYSTSAPSVRAAIRFFERVKEETTIRRREEALVERERRTKTQAQLLGDILVHDIRNYNQIIRASAEALSEETSRVNADLVEAIIRATDGSTALVEKAAKLSRIVAGGSPKLQMVNLEDSINRALWLVAKANPERPIILSSAIETNTVVMADELLDEVFVNLITNAVRYTESQAVPLEVVIRRTRGGPAREGGRRGFVSIAVIDHGRGIRGEVKANIFTRYQNSGGGTGLGLSIVHALVVDRYGGKLDVADRVHGNYTMGTKVNVTLRSSDQLRQTAPLQKNPCVAFSRSAA